MRKERTSLACPNLHYCIKSSVRAVQKLNYVLRLASKNGSIFQKLTIIALETSMELLLLQEAEMSFLTHEAKALLKTFLLTLQRRGVEGLFKRKLF